MFNHSLYRALIFFYPHFIDRDLRYLRLFLCSYFQEIFFYLFFLHSVIFFIKSTRLHSDSILLPVSLFFCCCCNFSYLMNKTFMKLPLFFQMTNFKLFSLPKLSYTINFIFIMITLMENRNGKRKKIVCGFFCWIYLCFGIELACVRLCMYVCVWARESIIYCPLCYRIISHAEKFCLISGSFLNIHVEWACELSLH